MKQATLHDGDSVLDVACGNGTLLGAFLRKAAIHAFGVDLSENMIAVSRERHPNLTFEVSPCVPLPFADNCMDIITVSCAFHHFEGPRAFGAECKRVLKPGGMLYMAEPFFHPWYGGSPIPSGSPSPSPGMCGYIAQRICAEYWKLQVLGRRKPT